MENIIIKHHYTFNNYRGRYVSRDFYLLNWGEKQSRDIIPYLIFDIQHSRGSNYSMNSDVHRLFYEVNSIQVEPNKREYIIIRQDKLTDATYEYLSSSEAREKVSELCTEEENIFGQIRFCHTNAELF
jgi:hypothetical protein